MCYKWFIDNPISVVMVPVTIFTCKSNMKGYNENNEFEVSGSEGLKIDKTTQTVPAVRC